MSQYMKRKIYYRIVRLFLGMFLVSALASGTSHGFDMKGVSYTAWQKDAMSSPESDLSLAAVRDAGANWIAICVWWFQDNVTSTTIEPDYTRYSASQESVIHAIQKSHEMGMKVMLKPMVDCRDGSWRGNINPSSVWFTAYQGFINFWADIAQQNNVELFSVGCELKNTILWDSSWRNTIQEVRTHYTGPLTYAANHGQEQNVSWWDEVDYIGIDAYYALTNSDDPILDELKTSWKNKADSIETWRNNNWPNMDIIFTEAGYQSVNGTNRTPWYTDPSTHTIDMLEQANCYEALLNQCRQRAWWRGVFWWNWETSPDGGGPDDPYWTPQNKPAELIMSNHYGFDQVELADIDSGLTSPSGDYRWLDIADQLYDGSTSEGSFIDDYNYTQARVTVQYSRNGSSLSGILIAQNLKPNFAYQLKLAGFLDTPSNELIGFTGRWWQEEWNGTGWINGQNLNNKGDGSFPNPNDLTYLERRDIPDSTSPNGKKYKYTGYLPFDHFITDENGNAAFSFEVNSSYHVFWKTTQRSPKAADGNVIITAFTPTPSYAYYTGYPESTVLTFGEWERLPVGGVFLPNGIYEAEFVLTEESFHGSGDNQYDGAWAAAMGAPTDFSIGLGEVVTIITAKYKAKPKQLLVEVTNSSQPDAVLTIYVDGIDYGIMTFNEVDNRYVFRKKISDPVKYILVSSDFGGFDTAVLGETTNTSPVANAGEDYQVTDSDGNGTETVTLDGSGSLDPDGTIQAYEWKENGMILGSSDILTLEFGLGSHTVTLTVTDNQGATDSDSTEVNVLPVGGPEVTIQRAEYTRKTKLLLVEASSDQQPDAVLTLEAYGSMLFSEDENAYIYSEQIKTLKKGAAVTVTSSDGGSDTALVTFK